MDFVRSSWGGDIINYLSGGRFLQFPEQQPGFDFAQHCAATRRTSVPIVSNDDDTVASGVVGSGADLEKDEKILENEPVADAEDAPADVIVVDWYGPDDPENPRNWNSSKRYFTLALVGFLTAAVYIGSSIYTPGVTELMAEFHFGTTVAALPLSVYVMAYGISPMLYGPMSEFPAIGRNWTIMPSLFVFVILQIPTALSKNLASLLVLRAITGFVSAPPLTVGGACIGDVMDPRYLAYGIASWACAASIGPIMGPFIGAAVTIAEDWRWTFWLLCWLSGLCFLVMLFLFPETSADTILYRRAARLRKLYGCDKYRTRAEIASADQTMKEFCYNSFVRPFIIAFREPSVFCFNCYTGLIYAVMYIFFEAFPIVFQEVHHFTLIENGLAYFGIFVGLFIIGPVYCAILHYYTIPRLMNGAPPELVLRVCLIGAPLLPVSLFVFGWTSSPDIHWIFPIIGSGIFFIGAFLIFQTIFAYLGMSYPRYIASVFGGNAFFRAMFAASFPLFARDMFVNLNSYNGKFPVALGSTILGCLGIFMIMIPIVLLWMGDRVRAQSRFAN
ncbi:major facilitator superfamily domain-containing protein [Limtongia smithiae]|uniref:major facilitator superfamily domain-containing protein n=1 Tax=Limtongia smithiae TaxID=1125753 RepID=UPI0034CFB2D4